MGNEIKNAYILYVQDGFDYLELGNLEQAMHHLVSDNPYLARHLVFVCIHPGDSFERWHHLVVRVRFFRNIFAL